MRDTARKVAKWLSREVTPSQSRKRLFVLVLQIFLLVIYLAFPTAAESLIELLRCGAHDSSWISRQAETGGFTK